MIEEPKKTLNPFRLWGSWCGAVLGLILSGNFLIAMLGHENVTEIGSFLLDISIFLSYLNPIYWFNPKSMMGILTLPIALFFWGWGINVLIRKLQK